MPRVRAVLGIALAAMAGFHLAARPAGAAESRFAIGDSIYVGPEDTLGRVTCIACSIRVDGTIEGQAYQFLGTLVNNGTIEHSAIVIGGSIQSGGNIGGLAMVFGGTLRLAGEVGGDAITVGGGLEVEDPAASIGGDAITIAGNQEGIDKSRVGGAVKRFGSAKSAQLIASGIVAAIVLIAVAVYLVLFALNGLTYFVLGTTRLEVIGKALAEHAPTCFLIGLVTSIVLGVVALLVAILLPLSLPMLVAFTILSVVGYCGLSFSVGQNLFSGLRPLSATQLAATLIFVIQFVPVVGWIATTVLWNVAIGGAVMSGFGTSPDWLTARAEGTSIGSCPPA